MVGKQRVKIVLGLRFIQDLADIPLARQKLRIKFRVRIPHAPDPEAVNIGCAALFDLVRNELGKLGIGGRRGHTDLSLIHISPGKTE